MRETPKPLEIYQHFKGNKYQVLHIAKDSEDGHEVVVYQALYGDKEIWVRSLEMFMSDIDFDKYPDVPYRFRFTKVEDAAVAEASSEEETYEMDPEIERFLDAGSYNEKLDILAGLRDRVTEEMIQIMAVASDIELNAGSLEERYNELKNCLITLDKFECDRLR